MKPKGRSFCADVSSFNASEKRKLASSMKKTVDEILASKKENKN